MKHKWKNRIAAVLLCFGVLLSHGSAWAEPVITGMEAQQEMEERILEETDIAEQEEPASAPSEREEDQKEEGDGSEPAQQEEKTGEEFQDPEEQGAGNEDETYSKDMEEQKPLQQDEIQEDSRESEKENEVSESEDSSNAEETFYLQENQGETASGIQLFSFDNSSKLPVSSVRYDKFKWGDAQGDASCPNLGIGIKYIKGDDQNVDGDGKWRYVYCLEFLKSAPIGGLEMQFQGWANRKVAYAMYYGAVYYYQTCRYAPYSTGDWQMDYFVTQMAIHILNGEFTMEAFQKALNRSGSEASASEKALALDRVTKIVNGANNPANYEGFTSDGWIDMNYCSFSLGGYRDTWTLSGDRYYSGGKFQAEFTSYYGYDFREQITGYEISVPSGVSVRKSDTKTYSDFDLFIKRSQFLQWQLTGKTIPVKVTVSVPRYWGAGIYSGPSTFQKVCLLTWGSEGGTARFTDSATLHIPQETYDLTIQKKDASTGEALSGAEFSLWAWDGTRYAKKVGNFQDQGDGSYRIAGIKYTQATDGWFLIKEDQAPEGYGTAYQLYNSVDRQNYETYGGRELQLTTEGFQFDDVPNGEIFQDPPLTPKADLILHKKDADTGKILSGAEFTVYEWSEAANRYKEEPYCVLEEKADAYQTKEALVRTTDNQGWFRIVETRLPEGYRCAWSKEIQLTEPGTVTLEYDAVNYPVRQLTIHKQIKAEDINWAHGNPAFFFTVTGTDLNGESHEYHRFVEFKEAEMTVENGYVTSSVTITNMPAGIYEVKEDVGVLRYILTDVRADTENVKVRTETVGEVNGVLKITADTSADLTEMDGEVTYMNEKVMHDQLSDNAVVVNKIL